jgi:hypothetical protein
MHADEVRMPLVFSVQPPDLSRAESMWQGTSDTTSCQSTCTQWVLILLICIDRLSLADGLTVWAYTLDLPSAVCCLVWGCSCMPCGVLSGFSQLGVELCQGA